MYMKAYKTILGSTAMVLLFSVMLISSCKKETVTVTPTCTDGIKNGTETGVDCGGSCNACISPVACFTVDNPISIIAGLINFTNCSSGATSYLWKFGDGDSSTAFSPDHRYLKSGTYTVTLKASNADTATTESSGITIVVNAATYAGTYHVAASCTQAGNSTYDASISPSGGSDIFISNFYNTGELLKGAVASSDISFVNQAIYGLTINGNGTLSSNYNTLTMSYTVVGGPTNDNCTAVYTRY